MPFDIAWAVLLRAARDCALGDVAALISKVELVVGNNSFPAHLAGTLGTHTFALMGPTRAACVFDHIPEVTPLSVSGGLGCTGCHFAPPYRAACDQGCQALHLLRPSTVFAYAAAMLSQPPRENAPNIWHERHKNQHLPTLR